MYWTLDWGVGRGQKSGVERMARLKGRMEYGEGVLCIGV